MEKQKPRVAKTILYNKGTGITIPGFNLYYRAISWYWHKSRHVEQWNQIEEEHINANTYGYLTFYFIKKNTLGKKTTFSTNSSGIAGCLCVEECKWIHIYCPTQNSSPSPKTST